MNLSIGILEFINIADSYYIMDKIIKKYSVEVFKLQKICPGRMMMIFYGSISNILDMIDYVESVDEINVKTSYVTGVSDMIMQAIKKKKSISDIKDIGVIEVKNAVYSFFIADDIIKKFDASILNIDFSLGLFGKSIIFINASTNDVQNAIKYANENFDKNKIICTRIITSPCIEIKNVLCKGSSI